MSEFVGLTGSTGVLGNIIKKQLSDKKINFSCFEGDITSKKDLKDWIGGKEFTSIIHLAAIVPIKEVDNNFERAFEVNVNGTKNILETLNTEQKKPWFFYASTSHVYKSKEEPLKEEDLLEPISRYGNTKLEAEKVIERIYDNFCIGRIFSFYHTTQKEPFLYPTLIRRLNEEDLSIPFELLGAESTRDFLNAEEIARIILALMLRKSKGIYNIASGKGTKIKDFLRFISDKNPEIIAKGSKDYLVANIDKLNKEINN